MSTDLISEKVHKIYVLVDPREPDHVRYVGYTSNTIELRLNEHIVNSRFNDAYKDRWIRSLTKLNIIPTTKLHKIVNKYNWKQEEISAIAYFKSLDHKLTNGTIGGDGGLTPEVCAKIVEKLNLPEVKLRMSNQAKLLRQRPDIKIKYAEGKLLGKELERQQQESHIEKLGFNYKTHKQCNKCFNVLPIYRFSTSNREFDKLYKTCKTCQSIAHIERKSKSMILL